MVLYCLITACGIPREYPDVMSIDQSGLFTVGARRHYTCHKGLMQTGSIDIDCVDLNGIPTWSDPLHSCIGKFELQKTCVKRPQKIYKNRS